VASRLNRRLIVVAAKKTAEDYEDELYEAETRLAAMSVVGPSVSSQQLEEAVEWLSDNHQDLLPDQADALYDAINAVRNYDPVKLAPRPVV
jgi:hypothetical protein